VWDVQLYAALHIESHLRTAGGGTVDLTSYRITNLAPQLEVEEMSWEPQLFANLHWWIAGSR
jgi:hypothetical protein